MDKLFNLMDGILGEKAYFRGLTFSTENGIIVVDYAKDVEYELEGGGVDVVDGYFIDYIPFNELVSPTSCFAMDEEGVKEIISTLVP